MPDRAAAEKFWRDGRAVEGARLESVCRATYRGFESHSLRHLVFYIQRLRVRTRARPEKTPRFRGVLAKVAPRKRTGDAGFVTSIAKRQAFISVGKFGGSDSLLIRAKVLKVAF